MKKINILFILLLIITTISCSEDKLIYYSDVDDKGDVTNAETNVFFTLKKWASFAKGIDFKMNYDGEEIIYKSITPTEVQNNIIFSYESVEPSHKLIIPISIMGNVRDYDRKVSVKTTALSDSIFLDSTYYMFTPRENVDYKILDAYIPANQVYGGVIVELILDTLKSTKKLSLSFEIHPNEEFSTKYDSIQRSSSKKDEMVSTLDFNLFTTYGIAKPASWDSRQRPHFGKFSEKKFLLLLDLGVPKNILTSNTPDIATISSYGQYFLSHLQYMQYVETPVLEDNGDKMTNK